MKFLIRIFTILLLASMCFLFISCKERTPDKKEDFVKIERLSAKVTDTKQEEKKKLSARKKIIVRADGDESEDSPITPAGQYVVIYKSESEITFTIKLDNPKGESIDAVELTCDDPNAEILVDGEYKQIQYQTNENGVKSRIVNWAQEDPYEKVYYIKTTSADDINTLRVIDLKVNGEWQNQALSNDELKIYKMEEEDLKWNHLQNSLEWYKWSFVQSEKVSNLKVMLEGVEVLPDAESVYTIEKSGKVEWKYDYTYNGVTVHWEDEMEIELFTWERTGKKNEITGEWVAKFYAIQNESAIYIKIRGSFIDLTTIEIKDIDTGKTCELYFYDNGKFSVYVNRTPNRISLFYDKQYILIINNTEYLIDSDGGFELNKE